MRYLYVLLVALTGAGAATLPSGFTETVVAQGLLSPTAMAFTPDGRLLVAEQGGALRVIKNGTLLAAPYVTINVDPVGERGLLGVAVDPNFAANGYVYVYYTTLGSPKHNRVVRFATSGDKAAGGETLIHRLDDLSDVAGHNGGHLQFGPDGKLYIATGENATPSYSQTLSNRLGKILRINSDGSIPADNPFPAATGDNRAIWAMGLRNPFRFAFQPGSSRMYINDVGAGSWEEINGGAAGANYGWPTTEGTFNPASFPSFTNPVFAYGHGSSPTTGCAITGGAFYNPPAAQFPSAYVGKYFFADYCTGWIRVLDPATGAASGFATGTNAPTDLMTGVDGALYYVSRGDGTIYKITHTGSPAPVVTTHPQSITKSVGESASFSVTASGAVPLSYQWQRNNVDIPGATSATYMIGSVSTGDNGAQFRCRVSNSSGSATSNAATLTVSSNRAPVPAITAPATGLLYTAGSTVQFSGTATDPEDGPLAPSAFTWEVVFHHDTHTHPALPPSSGSASGQFTIPQRGHSSTNVWYRIHLTIRDSQGRTASVFRDVHPRTVTLQFGTNPQGLQLTVDGQPVATPILIQGVTGTIFAIGAPSPQNGFVFGSWSDGGAATHEITTPSVNSSYVATFQSAGGGLGGGAPSGGGIGGIGGGTPSGDLGGGAPGGGLGGTPPDGGLGGGTPGGDLGGGTPGGGLGGTPPGGGLGGGTPGGDLGGGTPGGGLGGTPPGGGLGGTPGGDLGGGAPGGGIGGSAPGGIGGSTPGSGLGGGTPGGGTTPPPGSGPLLTGLSCTQSTLKLPLGSTTCTATLSAPAPAGGLTVYLSQGSAGESAGGGLAGGTPLAVPFSVTVPQGSTQATFPVGIRSGQGAGSAAVLAVLNGVIRQFVITVVP